MQKLVLVVLLLLCFTSVSALATQTSIAKPAAEDRVELGFHPSAIAQEAWPKYETTLVALSALF